MNRKQYFKAVLFVACTNGASGCVRERASVYRMYGTRNSLKKRGPISAPLCFSFVNCLLLLCTGTFYHPASFRSCGSHRTTALHVLQGIIFVNGANGDSVRA